MNVLPDVTDARVGEVMLRHPKTLSADASIDEARQTLANEHVHMVLITEGAKLVGTLTQVDLPPPGAIGPALSWSTLEGRTVSPGASASDVQRLMIDHGVRRVAVVGPDGTLLGLMCLKRRRTGFCSDADVLSRGSWRSNVLLDG